MTKFGKSRRETKRAAISSLGPGSYNFAYKSRDSKKKWFFNSKMVFQFKN